ncbi:YhcB family protein [Paraferrimonas sedimenticola]|uniref:Z-ring associated protein G n=1 Tax=Paraferrimonas sedimenticola TaxID=375674 RepID=A0AA37VUD4_9GAMM|nr:DUF1043 family protein [Paraferrimonas sedimenticola]GLP95814.1 membrane protein [Paraferrimonas sedimenticola]
MDWALVVAAFVVGSVGGYVARSLLSKSNNDSTGQLDQAKFALEQQKQEVSDHFAQTHEILEQITDQVNRLNTYWNESSKNMLGETAEKQLVTFTPATVNDGQDPTELPPKDYVHGSQQIIAPPNTKAS